MAEGGPKTRESVSDDDQLENLRKQATCPKCRKPFVQPKLLPCLHCACALCLPMREGVRDREGLRYIVVCPKCSQETELSRAGVSDLPAAFFKTRLAGVYLQLEKLEAQKRGSCEECSESNSTVVARCSDCEHFICSRCVETHQQMKVLSTHKIVSLKDHRHNLLEQISSPVRHGSFSAMLCQKHSEPLKIYCKTCRRLICKDCTVLNHAQPKHNWDFMESLVSGQKADLQRNLQTIREMYAVAEMAVTDGKSALEKAAVQKDLICDTISSSFDKLITRLEECRERVLENSKKEVELKLTHLSDQIQQMDLKANELQHLIRVCEQSAEHTTDQEFMALKWHMVTRVKEVTAKRQQFTPEAIDRPSMFLSISCSQEIMDTCLSHLQHHHSVGLSETTVTGSGATRAEVGTLAQFTIHARNSAGRPCLEKHNITVEINLPRYGDPVSLTVTPGFELGTYVVSYLPERRGQYNISVKVDKAEIACSPFYVTVKPPRFDQSGPVQIIPNQDWPWGIACTSNRELYITKKYHHKISVLDKDGRQIRTMGMKGQKAGHLLSPTGIAVDEEGHIFVADGEENGRLQKLNKNFQLEAVFAQLSHPHGVLLSRDGSKLYVCDQSNQRIVVLDTNLKMLSTFGELSRSAGEGYQEVNGFVTPHSVAEDSQGNIYVTDMQNHCIQVYSDDGIHQRNIVNPHSDMFTPTGIHVEQNQIFVSDCGENQLVVFSTEGQFVTSYGAFGTQEGQFYNPLSMAMDADGFLYVCDHCNGRIQVF